MKNPAAVDLGRKGGSVKSEAKTKSSAANGAKGGRPKMSVIRSFNTALGGYEFRATGNEGKVNMQRKGPRASKFQTVVTLSREEWRENEMSEMSISDFSGFIDAVNSQGDITYKEWKSALPEHMKILYETD